MAAIEKMIMLVIILLCFMSNPSVDALYRVQSKNIKSISKPEDRSNVQSVNVQSLRQIEYFQPQVAKGSTCSTGCPNCDVTDGTTGTVMSAPVTLYHIYIGHAASDYASGVKFRTILDSLATGLQNTPTSSYMNILSGYTDTHGNTASKQFTFGGAYVYTYSSTAMSETIVANAIGAAISSNTGIKMDTHAIYTVFFRGDSSYCFTSNGVSSCWAASGGWCGYHSSIIPTGQSQYVVFSTVGDTTYGSVTGCSGLISPPTGSYYDVSSYYVGVTAPLTTCIDSVTHTHCTFGQTSTCIYCIVSPPNGDVPSDGAVSVYMHEVFEAITDGLNGFYVQDSTSACYGNEVGDLCAESYSSVTPTSSSGSYNLQLSNGKGGTLYFMSQDMFYHPTKTCSNGIPYPNTPSNAPVKSVPIGAPTNKPVLAPTQTTKPSVAPIVPPTPVVSPTNAPVNVPIQATIPTGTPVASPSSSSLNPVETLSLPSASPSLQPSVTGGGPSSAGSNSNASSGGVFGNMSSGTMIGIAVAVIFGVAFIVAVVWYMKSSNVGEVPGNKQPVTTTTVRSPPPPPRGGYSNNNNDYSNGYSNYNNYSSGVTSPQKVAYANNLDRPSQAFGVARISKGSEML